jgi:2-methylisocitrate lyase-like PEP mutase family enzyme
MASGSLRDLLARDGLLVAPGAYDGIGARLVEQAGFPIVYMTGAGTAAALGFPDYGLVTLTEMAANAAVLARTVSIPVLADADTGYGNQLNVTRTVREFEAVGTSGIHIEDQVAPKRCGHLDGKQVVDRGEFTFRIRAAVAARRSEDFVIIARTDAISTNGLQDAIDRANAALDEGADIAFVEAPETLADTEAIPERVHGPCLLNVVPGGKTPVTDLNQAEQMGYRLALCPGLLLATAVIVGELVLKDLAEKRVHPTSGNATVGDLFSRLGAREWDSIRRKYDNHDESTP